jgi:hypothetical protein
MLSWLVPPNFSGIAEQIAAHVLTVSFPSDFVSKSRNTQSIPSIFRLHQTKNLLVNLRTSTHSALPFLPNIFIII